MKRGMNYQITYYDNKKKIGTVKVYSMEDAQFAFEEWAICETRVDKISFEVKTERKQNEKANASV